MKTAQYSGNNIVHVLTMYVLISSQLAERDPNQECGRSSTRRGSLLCSMWEEAASVSGCNEGKSKSCKTFFKNNCPRGGGGLRCVALIDQLIWLKVSLL